MQATDHWQELYLRPLFDLGERGASRLRGIHSPIYDDAVVNQHIHAQFTDDASTYAAKYQDTDYWTSLLTTALQRTSFAAGSTGLRILDIGSGAGNSIIPLLRLFPQSLVIGSDFSIDLLLLLRDAVQSLGLSDSCRLLQLNAEELDFQSATFDLVVGGAVLHHLFSPDLAVKGCAKILKPGGVAVFFEPFENGNMLLRMAYQQILDHPKASSIAARPASVLKSLIADFDMRKGRDKSAPIFRDVDDKWLFTTSYFHELSEKNGFSSCRIHPLHDTIHQFEAQTAVFLRLAAGLQRDSLPEWAWAIVRSYDASFSEDLKADLLIEGCILLTK
jgi:ubiquinone/menaquinone biosynthesis C-methylase UbiE